MADASIRDLRNHGGEVVERASRGERITITRSGKPVAAIVALRGDPTPLAALLVRWRRLPPIDPGRLRADVDSVVDPTA